LGEIERLKFIVDQNAGKLTKLLRLLGYDSTFFTGETDSQLVNMALAENRIILTRDTHIPERRLITSGKVKALLIKKDGSDQQIMEVINDLHLDNFRPFTLCLEDNGLLFNRTAEEVKIRVPRYVKQTQKEYMECPKCHRIYWKGTHWAAMTAELKKLTAESVEQKT
jgi:uncharacterized protein